MDNEYLSRRHVIRAFKMRGLSLQSSALDAMLNVLQREQSSQQKVLEAILDDLKERILSDRSLGTIVTQEFLAQVVADLSRNSQDIHEEALQLLNAMDMPRLDYDSMRKQFTLVPPNKKQSFFGTAKDKIDMNVQRFALVQQRILRQDLFRPKLVTADGRSASNHVTHAITPVESLLGRSGTKFLLGMIVQVEEGRYYLEDTTAQVPLNLQETQVLTDGFITEHSIVLVEGEMMDGILHVQRMGNPIVETRMDALDAIGLQPSDIFSSMSTLSQLEKLHQQEYEHGPNGNFVVLSQIHLDKPTVLGKLEILLTGFQEMDPLPVFVFMGNFFSSPSPSPKAMIFHFEELAHLIAKFPRLAKSAKFVFVPGSQDPGGHVLPTPPLPKYFTAALRSKLSNVHFGSNPCRIRYFSKELVFFASPISQQLRRNAILKPSSSSGWVQHLIKTLLDQGHVCPLAQQPILWQHDHALRLYPLPDSLILGDATLPQFYEVYAECNAVNPGSFSSDFDFVVYSPVAAVDETTGTTTANVEFSQIGNDCTL